MDRWSAMQSFVRVVESGSFVAAAERLGTSTSSLSRQIADLEQHLGTRLLNRTTRRLSLTERGQAFYERSAAILDALDEAKACVHNGEDWRKGTVSIGAIHTVAPYLLPEIVQRFTGKFSDAQVAVEERFTEH